METFSHIRSRRLYQEKKLKLFNINMQRNFKDMPKDVLIVYRLIGSLP